MSKAGKLSERLKAAAALVPEGASLADIGTDHGFLPITLLRQGHIRKAVAMDIGSGPLSRAKEHIYQAGLSDRIAILQSDGFAALKQGEADVATILGMGGALIQRILSEGDPAELGIHTLVLGPQSEVPAVRRFLLEREYRIETERLVAEDGKYYFLLRVRTDAGEEDPYSDAELLYGRSLIASRDETLFTYLRSRKKQLEEIGHSLEAATSAASRCDEVAKELTIISDLLPEKAVMK